MSMYIENPHKKVSYSFRIHPDLLENIKLYAKATDQTVPEILNNMIEEKIDGLHLTNDYLDNKLSFNGVISIPPLTELYNNGQYQEFNLFTERNNRVLYEIKKIPNNLDIWTDNDGFKSDKRGVNHEGISFVLAPELITDPKYLENPELLYCCLVPIYFKVSINSIRKSTISVTNIGFDEAFKKINKAPNIELLDDFTSITNKVKEIIFKYTTMLNNAEADLNSISYRVNGFWYSDYDELLKDILGQLILELDTIKPDINKDIITQLDGSIERLGNKPTPVQTLDNVITTDTIITEILEENTSLQAKVQELETENNNLQNKISNLNNLFDEIDERISNIEERRKIWEDLARKEKEFNL